MNVSPGLVEFYGVVGRIETADSALVLRAYPFDFDAGSEAQPVLALRFDGPDFAAGDLSALTGVEVEILVFPDRVELHDVFNASTSLLQARHVISDRVSYDREDLLSACGSWTARWSGSTLR